MGILCINNTGGEREKMNLKAKHVSKRLLAVFMTAAMAAGSGMAPAVTASAADYTYVAPTQPMGINSADVDGDGQADNIITATAHYGTVVIPEILGCNTTTYYGPYTLTPPTSLADAETKPGLGTFGTSLNDQPDPYYWNYFYNFYVGANSKDTISNTLLNPPAGKQGPYQADTTLLTEYGGISASLAKRPMMLIGVASSATSTDTNGYDSQLTTIHDFATNSSPYYQTGDESYNPKLVPYTATTITDMIDSIKNTATVMNTITAEAKASDEKLIGRYGDPATIASDYEKYVYSIPCYIMEELAAKGLQKKKIALVTAINSDGSYTLANPASQDVSSQYRALEFCQLVTDNIASTYGTTVTKDQLLTSDVIITTTKAASPVTQDQLVASFGTSDLNSLPMMITTSPVVMGNMFGNCVESSVGFGYFLGYIYSDELDINPVDMSAYYYEKFYHVSDLESLKKETQVNFANVILPEGMTGELTSDYSTKNIEAKLIKGMEYYESNPSVFESSYIANSGWKVDWTQGIGSGQSQTISGVSASYSKTYKKGYAFQLSAKSTAGAISYTSGNAKVATVDSTGKVYVKGAGTVNLTITAASTGKYAQATKTVKITVKKATQTISLNNASKKYKASALKKKSVSFKIGAKDSGSGKLSYKVLTGKKYISVSSAGTVKVAKKAKKGTYYVRVSAAATSNYNAATKNVKIIVK